MENREQTYSSFLGFEEFNAAARSNYCANFTAANKTLDQYLDLLYKKGKLEMLQQCPVPCEQTMYVSRVNKFHKNSYFGSDEESAKGVNNSFVYLSIGYETFNTELHFETLIYDTGNFLTQIGGNLGLFLGISCFSALAALTEFLHIGFFQKRFLRTLF